MMLSTAFAHIDDDGEEGDDEMEDAGQPVRHQRENTTPTKARFTKHPHEKLLTNYIVDGPSGPPHLR
jgi:hypothetical protein